MCEDMTLQLFSEDEDVLTAKIERVIGLMDNAALCRQQLGEMEAKAAKLFDELKEEID